MRKLSRLRKLGWLVLLVLPLVLVLTLQGRNHAAVGELGQTLEGAGSANFDWLQHPGMKFGVAFRATKSGTLREIALPWKSKGSYGAGTLGVFDFELHRDGPDHFPAEAVIGSARNILPREATDGRLDGALRVPLTAELIKGEVYHLVVSNVDPDPKRNWSCPNTLMTRVRPWDGAGFKTAFYADGAWRPWASKNNPFNARRRNDVSAAHCPLLLRWDDDSVTGDPYYSSAERQGAYLYGHHRAGELIAWKEASVSISRVGISVWKRGKPSQLIFRLESEEGRELAAGILPGAQEIGNMAGWVYAALPAPVELRKGRTYRLWFASPDSPDEQNCYYQYVPYGDQRPADWLECGWGGTASHYIHDDGAGWVGEKHMDLTFSLQ
ncbi:MAG: hypothetical protein ACYDCO_23000 [Armatimonadota bacterium]